VVVGVVLVLLVAAGAGGWLLLRDEPEAQVGTSAEPQVVEVTSGTIGESISAEGTVAAAETEDLSFTSSGTVSSVAVSAGDTVTAGQVLATIESAELASALADARAELADTEAELDAAVDSGASDEQVEVLEAAVVTAADSVDAAEEALEGTTLTASFDGLVTSVELTVGEQLGSSGTSGTSVTGTGTGSGQSSSQLGEAETGVGATGGATTGAGATSSTEPQIRIVSAGAFVVDLSVDTSDIDRIEVGQEVDLSISTDSAGTTTQVGGFGPPGMGGGFPGGAAANDTGTDEDDDDSAGQDDITATGTVSEVSGVADASSGVATYTVGVSFADDSGDVWAGSTATAEIDVGSRTDVTQVSAAAVTTSEGVSTVTVALDGTTDGRTEQREVTTGEASGAMVEIVDGLEPGDQVIVEMPAFGGGGGGMPGGGEMPEGFEPPAGGGFPGAAAGGDASTAEAGS
jgi:macrolide-specific efflux system membrane fusion protein